VVKLGPNDILAGPFTTISIRRGQKSRRRKGRRRRAGARGGGSHDVERPAYLASSLMHFTQCTRRRILCTLDTPKRLFIGVDAQVACINYVAEWPKTCFTSLPWRGGQTSRWNPFRCRREARRVSRVGTRWVGGVHWRPKHVSLLKAVIFCFEEFLLALSLSWPCRTFSVLECISIANANF